MKKTTYLFSVLLLAVLILLIPAPRAEATGGHSSHSGFTAWTKTTELPTESGNYYLTQNVTLQYAWVVSGNIRLCLNGKTISVNTELPTKQAVIVVNAGAKLKLEDCSAAGSGLVTCKSSGKVSTAGIAVYGTFAMYGGNVANVTTGTCGGVAVFKGGEAYLYGGVIHDNKASAYGGGVCAYGGKAFIDGAEICKNESTCGGGVGVFKDPGNGTSGSVTFYSGSIHDNRATSTGAGGGGVYVGDSASFSMSGGEICNNSATNSGGGLFAAGLANIAGGSIRDNKATNSGGGILVNGGSVAVTVASISGNSAASGGGIYTYGSVTMYDCRIEGNTASRAGGGVYVTTGRANVKGRLKITGNKLTDGDASNFYIEKNDKHLIYVMDEMDSDADIGLYLGVALKSNEEYVLTNSLKTNGGSDGLSAFSCDQTDYNVCQSANGLEAIVLKKPVITKYPQDVTAAEGGTATFTVKAEGLYLSYQWEYSYDGGENWLEIGENSPSLTVMASASYNGYLFHVYVSNPGYGFFTKTPVKLTVMKKPAITTQPSSVTSAAGKTVKFTVAASGTSLSYQWQYSKDNGATWANSTMTGYNTKTLTVDVTSARNGYLYRCVAKNAVGSATSNGAKLTVSGVKPAIRVQPADIKAATGSTAKFKVVAAGEGLTYRWQYSRDNGSTWANSSATGYNTATLSVEAASARNGYLFKCIVKNSAGSTTSSSAKLTVMPAPAITTQPSSVTSAAGKTVKFTVAASGSGLSYQWQWSKDNGATWTNSSATGYNTATLTVEVISARNGYRYRCVVKNAVGSATSNSAKLTVSGVKPAITGQPKSVTATAGKTVKFTVTAAGTGLSYQWQYSKDGGATWSNSSATGYNTATLSVEAISARNGYRYRCIVKNSAGSVTSSTAKLTVS